MPKQLCKAVFGSALLIVWMLSAQAQTASLLDMYDSARAAFLAEQYSSAADLFESIESEYSSEPEFTEQTFQKHYLSMFALSALLSGDRQVAIEAFEKYMASHYKKEKNDGLLLLGYIQACRNLEDVEKLDQLYGKFLADFPEHKDRNLIHFEKMLALFNSDQMEPGLAEMQSIAQSYAPKDLRFRALLVGIQKLINHDDYEQAGEIFLTTQWEISSMPEMAVLATSALKLGEHYMVLQQWEQAIQTYRWVPFYKALVETQRNRLRMLQIQMQKVSERDPSNQSMVWKAHYENLILQVRTRLQVLEQGIDYTPGFLLKYGRCYLFTEQFAEAWVVFRSLALTEGIESVIEEQAWYHWILASHGSENFDETRELCLQFAERFSGSDLLPKTFYMLARTHQENGDYMRANRVLTDLIERFPENGDNAQWHITRGFNFASLNENEMALIDFEAAIESSRESTGIVVRARYWRGVTLSSLDRFEDARGAFTRLIDEYPHHWMFPEFQYRLATVYYSDRDYGQAEKMLNTYLGENPDHFYAHEARVLLGDVAMGKGELDRATELFSMVQPSDANLFMYAYFQIGKIHKAREQYSEMESHYRKYLEEIDFKGKARTSEALYLLGWALTMQDREIETLPLYLDALDQYGDDPLSGELIPMISALEVLKRNVEANPVLWEQGANETPSIQRFIAATSFDEWLVGQMDDTKSNTLSTFYARLQLYEALKLRRSKEPELARKAIQSISVKTSMEDLDDMLLGEIGVSLAEDGFEASLKYLRRLLVIYPRSASKALAYYGLGLYSSNEGKWEDSLKWLNLFEKETPNHPKLFDVRLLKGKVLVELMEYEKAADTYNGLLKLKQARGTPHVKALLGLAAMHEQQHSPEQAIPYFQRIYTLYRAYRPYVALAYLRSALLFESIGDVDAAKRSLEELLDQDDLIEFSEFTQARNELDRLNEKYPESPEPDPDASLKQGTELQPLTLGEGA